MTDTKEKEQLDTAHVEDVDKVWLATTSDAQQGAANDHALTLFQALKKHRKAVFWALALYLALVMENYDQGLVNAFMGYPEFRKKYGEYTEKGGYQIKASWQSALGLSTTLGLVFGIIANGILVERFGYKKVLLVSYVTVTGFIFIPFFAPSIGVLFVGEVLCGLPWGVFSIAGPAYASEVAPTVLRGYLQVYGNLCAIMGQLIAAGVLQGLVSNTTEWSYRIPFAVQWAWPVPLAILTILAPESPWWLVRRNRLKDAEHSLSRLSNSTEDELRQNVAMMVHTNELEQKISAGTSYLDCFKGSDLRRTEIAAIINSSNCLCGFAITSATTYFMQQAGLKDEDSYKMGLGSSALGFLGTSLCWFGLKLLGRRSIALIGMGIMGTLMTCIGVLGSVTQTPGVKWAQPILLMVWVFIYNLSVGPVTWSLTGEISGTRLRAKTIGIARNTYNIVNIVNFVAYPYILNPNEANWQGKTGFLAAGITLVIWIWGFFRIPETKGRTYEELDLMFDRGVPARAFRNYEIDAYHGEEEKRVLGDDPSNPAK